MQDPKKKVSLTGGKDTFFRAAGQAGATGCRSLSANTHLAEAA